MYAVSKERSRLTAAALEKIPCDLTIQNVRLFNVFTGEKYPVEVDVLDGVVVRVRTEGEKRTLPAAKSYDGGGAWILPGYIDTHMHIESTMMIPEQVSRAIVPWGTTTICTDPHEIGNVMGEDGVAFMIDNAKQSKLRQYVLAPSCVPAVPGLETAGAVFGASEVGRLMDRPEVIGIAELMDFVGVCNDSERMHGIIDEGIKRNGFLQGHAPALTGKELAAYIVGGPESCHESSKGTEIREKLRNGLRINLRASTILDVVPELISGFIDHDWYDNVSMCTDDVHAADLLEEGHINWVVNRAVSSGMRPEDAIKCATLNAARELGFKDLGAVAPGYAADFQLVRSLDGARPEAVFIAGELVAENGVYFGGDELQAALDFPNTVDIDRPLAVDQFVLRAPEEADSVRINVIVPLSQDNIIRRVDMYELPVKEGLVQLPEGEDMQYVCVLNRYGTGSRTLGVFKGFGLKQGAFATTVTHDSHNLIVVYKDASSALLAVQSLVDCGGGMCAVENGVVTALPLPVAGLMSCLNCKQVAVGIRKVEQVLHRIARPDMPILSASIMSLTALPGVIITDLGIVDGSSQSFVPLFTE